MPKAPKRSPRAPERSPRSGAVGGEEIEDPANPNPKESDCHNAVGKILPGSGIENYCGLFAKCLSATFILTERGVLPTQSKAENGRVIVGGIVEGQERSKKSVVGATDDRSSQVGSESRRSSVGDFMTGSIIGGGGGGGRASFFGGSRLSAKDEKKKSSKISESGLGGFAASVLGGESGSGGEGSGGGLQAVGALDMSSEIFDPTELELDAESLYVTDEDYNYSIVGISEGDNKLPDRFDISKYTAKETPSVGSEVFVWEHMGDEKRMSKCKVRRVTGGLVYYMVMAAPKKKGERRPSKAVAEDMLGVPGTPVFCKCEDGNGFLLLALQREKQPSGLIEGLLVAPMVKSIEIRLTMSNMDAAMELADTLEYELTNLRRLTVDDENQGKTLLIKHRGMNMIRRAMAEHEESSGVVEQASAVLRNLACDETNHEDIMELFKLFYAAMIAKKEEAGVQEQILGLMGNLASTPQNKKTMLEFDLVEHTFEMMSTHMENAGVTEQAIGALWNLGINDKHALEKITGEKFDGIKLICQRMTIHLERPGVQAIGSGALANLVSKDQEGKKIAAEKGALKCICAGMAKHYTDEHVARQACAALWSLTANYKENQALAVAEGALVFVAQALELTPVGTVQEAANGALRNLTAFSPENKEKAMEVDIVDKICSGMSVHRRNVAVQKQACGALWNLAAGASPKAIATIVDSTAIEEICEAIKHHGTDQHVLENGLGALRNIIAGSEEARDSIMDAGLVGDLGDMMEANLENTQMQRVAFEFVSTLAAGGTEYCDGLIKTDMIKVIVKSVETNMENPVVLERGCACLRRCSAGQNNVQEAIIENNGLNIIVEAMEEHEDTTLVQRQACSVLECLAGAASSRWRTLEEAGALKQVTQAMKNHPVSAFTQEQCCRVLRACSHGADSGVKSLLKLKALDLVCQAMSEHLQSGSLQEQGCGFLFDLSCTTDGLDHVTKTSDVIRQAIKALEAHPAQEGVNRYALEFLKTLSADGNQKIGAMILSANAVKRVGIAMLELPMSEPVHLAGCNLLYHLTAREDGKDRILTSDALQRVCASMEAHIQSIDIQRAGMRVFKNLLGKDFSRTAVADAGGIQRLSSAMKTHERDMNFQPEAFTLIGALVDNLKANQDIAAKVGVIEQITEGMTRLVTTVSFQCIGCDVICSLVVGNAENKERTVNAGGLKCICDALTVAQKRPKGAPPLPTGPAGPPTGSPRPGIPAGGRPGIPGAGRGRPGIPIGGGGPLPGASPGMGGGSPRGAVIGGAGSPRGGGSPLDIEDDLEEREKLKIEALTCLWILAQGNHVQPAIIESKAIPMVTAMMTNEEHNALIQARSCGALACFAGKTPEGQEAVAKNQGVALVGKAMTMHLKDEAVQHAGCSAFWHFSAGNAKMKAAIGEAQGVQKICEAMESHLKHVRVQRTACAALWNLACYSDKNKEEIVRQNGINRVLKAITHHKSDAVIARHACETLATLAFRSPVNQRAITEAEGIHKICSAMQHHTDVLAVQQQCMAALGNISYMDYDIKTDIMRAGGLTFICTAMENHSKEALVQEFGCWALANLSVGHPEMKQAIVDAGARDLINHALRKFSDDHDVQTIGYAALRRLEGVKETKTAYETEATSKKSARYSSRHSQSSLSSHSDEGSEEDSQEEKPVGRMGSLLGAVQKRLSDLGGLATGKKASVKLQNKYDEETGQIIQVPVFEKEKKKCCAVM